MINVFISLFITYMSMNSPSIEVKSIFFELGIPTSMQTLDYHTGSDYVLFLHSLDTSYYLVQQDSPSELPSRVGFVSFVPGTLVIRNLNDASLITFSVGSIVNGIGHFKGTKFNEELLSTSSSGVVLVDYPPIDALSCKCHPVAEVLNFVCEHGGEGSTACEVTDGGTTGPVSWTNHCSVSCGTGYFACCNE